MLTNTHALCFILGWQGGTVHQVAEAIKVPVNEILDADEVHMGVLARIAQQVRAAQFPPALLPQSRERSCHWCHSDREENNYTGYYATAKEAVEAARNYYDEDQEFYVGRAASVSIDMLFPDMDWLMEHMLETANDYVGDVAFDAGFANDKNEEALKRARLECCDAFARAGIVPRFFEVLDGKLIKKGEDYGAELGEKATETEGSGGAAESEAGVSAR